MILTLDSTDVSLWLDSGYFQPEYKILCPQCITPGSTLCPSVLTGNINFDHPIMILSDLSTV